MGKKYKKLTKSRLAIILSKLEGFSSPKVRDEQYITPSEIAADILWKSYLQSDIRQKVIVDLGAGTGILGIGAAMLGATKVSLVEKDKKSLQIAKENKDFVESETGKDLDLKLINKDISELNAEIFKCDSVIMNPPFGVKREHADRNFLKFAFNISKVIYSLHKSNTLNFVEKISSDNGFCVSHKWHYDFDLKATYKFHKKKIRRIEVSCVRIVKI